MNFVFGEAYGCPEGYTPLMCAAHRSRLECCKALLRSGADPNYINASGDLVLFWGIDGGIEIVKLLHEVRATGEHKRRRRDTNGLRSHPSPPSPPPAVRGGPRQAHAQGLDAAVLRPGQGQVRPRPREGHLPRGRAAGAPSLPQAVAPLLLFTHALLRNPSQYYGASKVGTGPERSGARSPRQSYNPEGENFGRDRGSYQEEMEHP